MDPPLLPEESLASFEWTDLFNFAADEQLFHNSPPPPAESSDNRVRKRDPRLVCENFLAGILPCACPEMDALMQEEEEAGPGKKKKMKIARKPGLARCQVPGCEADISELKGYHRRHRVCLKCANEASVVLDGESKRYCQQCGKFHVLSDFDEGKRSCRRKLERHNNRRRRKLIDSTETLDKEPQGDLNIEDISSDGEAGKENAWSVSQMAERVDSKHGTVSNLCLAMDSRNIGTNLMICEKEDKVTDNSSPDQSPPSYDNKSTYSSACPTGRMSFKLYDWNPAEFPRRLRHQIFQWLANMPVELEGYIRPGCTILTAFVSMPQFMWMKLSEDPFSYVRSAVGAGGMLSGTGMAVVYLNNMSFRVLKDGASVMKIDVATRIPKLNYVYPPCFEAGKPMDFIVCGSNLLQPKFRSLISFAGEYLPHDYYVASPRGEDMDGSSVHFDHQYCRIYVPQTEPAFSGPAFIEVENESGLSNFVPIIIGDEHVCSEIKMIHGKYYCSHCKKKSHLKPFGSSENGTCEVSCPRQTSFTEFMLDVAWLLKGPPADELHHVTTSSQIQRLYCLLNFLISNKSTFILERVLQRQQIVLDEMEACDIASGVNDCDRRLLKRYIGRARDFLSQSARKDQLIVKARSHIPQSNDLTQNGLEIAVSSVNHAFDQVKQIKRDANCNFLENPDFQEKRESVSLLKGENSMSISDIRQRPSKSCNLMLPRKYANSRPLVYMIVAVAVCLGVCAVVFHPHRISKLVVTIRTCLFDNSR